MNDKKLSDNFMRVNNDFLELSNSVGSDPEQMSPFQAWQAAYLLYSTEDTARVNWLEQHDDRYHNIDKIAAIVGTGFLTGQTGSTTKHKTLREAIDKAMLNEAEAGGKE